MYFIVDSKIRAQGRNSGALKAVKRKEAGRVHGRQPGWAARFSQDTGGSRWAFQSPLVGRFYDGVRVLCVDMKAGAPAFSVAAQGKCDCSTYSHIAETTQPRPGESTKSQTKRGKTPTEDTIPESVINNILPKSYLHLVQAFRETVTNFHILCFAQLSRFIHILNA